MVSYKNAGKRLVEVMQLLYDAHKEKGLAWIQRELQEEVADLVFSAKFPMTSFSYPEGERAQVCYLRGLIGRKKDVFSYFPDGFHFVFENEYPRMAYCIRIKNEKVECIKHPIGMCPYSSYRIQK